MKLGEFAFEAKQTPCMKAIAGLTVEEWQAIKDFVFHGAICNEGVFKIAEEKVLNFEKNLP